MTGEYFLKRRGIWSSRLWSHSLLFNYFIKPAIHLDLKLLELSQYWPEVKIKNIQWQRITDLLQKVHGNNKFWNNRLKESGLKPKDIKNWSDFQKIPVTKKEDMRGLKPEITISVNTPARWLFKDSTSGSTGVPFNFVVDRGFVLRSLAFNQRMFRMMGQKPDDIFVRFSPSDRPGLNFKNYFFQVRDYNEFEKRTEEFIDLYKNKTLLVYGVSSYLVELSKQLEKRPHKIEFRAAIASGEAISDIQKKFVEERLRCPVSRCYATRELGCIAQECPQEGFHINQEWAYIEIVDEAGNTLPKGAEGRIVVTTFDNEAMPFIRYDTGDIGEISGNPCACGRSLPLIKFRGRKNGFIFLKDGRKVHHFNLLAYFHQRADKIKKFQITQKKINKISVKIVPEENLSQLEVQTIRNELAFALKSKTDSISVELVNSLPSGPRGKSAAFVSKLYVDQND